MRDNMRERPNTLAVPRSITALSAPRSSRITTISKNAALTNVHIGGDTVLADNRMHSVFSRGAYFSLDSLFSTRQRVNAAIMSSSPGSSPDENHSSSRSGTRPNSTPIESSSHSVKHKRREVRRQRECCRKLITQGSKPWMKRKKPSSRPTPK
ncbi:hypothetical protein BDZ89DRAFT_474745 [Hymenopellis radicata]|nr:hypothetical protein BDZ89DRAFT_474745 [Hymenopellis radicata]